MNFDKIQKIYKIQESTKNTTKRVTCTKDYNKTKGTQGQIAGNIIWSLAKYRLGNENQIRIYPRLTVNIGIEVK